MNRTTFFVLAGGYCHDGSMFELYTDDWTEVGEAPKCSLCGRITGMCQLVPPIRGVLEAERWLFDLTMTVGGDILLTERCWQFFERERIQGLVDPVPVDVVGVEGSVDLRDVGRYLLASVQVGAAIDRVKSGLKTSEAEVCPLCGLDGIIESYDRVAVDMESWTGLDVFRITGLPGTILVTPRVREVCEGAGLSICKLIPAEKYSR